MKTWGLIIVLLAVAGDAARAQQQMPMTMLSDHIKIAENTLLNVQVHSSYTAEEWDPKTSEWTDAGHGQMMAWFVGRPGSKVRFDTDEVGRWVGGKVPFSHDVFVDAYNGRAKSVLVKKSGNPEHPDLTPRGEVQAGRFVGFNGFASGWINSIYGARDEGTESQKLSEYFEKISQLPGLAVATSTSTVNSVPCVVVTVSKAGNPREKWYFDPQRAYALVSEQQLNEQQVVTNELVVEQMVEASPGIFYPTRCTRIDRKGDGTPWRRLKYNATAVTVNSPSFSEDIFEMRWPAGTVVHDTVLDITFVVSDTEEELRKTIETQLVDVSALIESTEREVATQNSIGTTHPSSQPSTQPVHRVGNEQRIHGSYLWIVGAVILVAGTIAVLLKRRRCKISMFLICAMLLGDKASHAQYSFAFDELNGAKVANCGLNCTLFMLRYFKTDASMTQLAEDLNVGSQWERPASMAEIKRALERRGLTVDAYKEATFEETRSMLNENSIVLVHAHYSTVNHYYVLLRGKPDGVLYDDVGKAAEWLTGEKLAEFKETLTGHVLRVSRGPKRVEENVHLLSNERIVVETTVEEGQGDLVIPVNVRNPASHVVTVKHASGDCNCFKTVRIKGMTQPAVEAGGEAVLELVFSRSSFGRGTVRRKVVITVDDGKERSIIVELKANVIANSQPGLAWFPEKLEMGIMFPRTGHRKGQTVTLRLPSGGTIAKVMTSSPRVNIVKLQGGNSETQPAGEEGSVVRYRVEVQEAPTGPFSEMITFELENCRQGTVQIPVTGEVRTQG